MTRRFNTPTRLPSGASLELARMLGKIAADEYADHLEAADPDSPQRFRARQVVTGGGLVRVIIVNDPATIEELRRGSGEPVDEPTGRDAPSLERLPSR